PSTTVYRHPKRGSQTSAVHGLPSSQSTTSPGTHVPSTQVSPWVQASPSEQAPVRWTHWHPAALSQKSSVQGFWSLQSMTVPWQPPLKQVSPVVHTLPSSHGFWWKVCTQPLAGSHASFVHGLPSSQSRAVPPTQLPAWHTLPFVH